MAKIVYERLRVNEKKLIKAGVDQLPITNDGCSTNVAPPSNSPRTVENDCYGLGTPE